MLNNVFLLPRNLTELQFHPVSCGVCDSGVDFTRVTARETRGKQAPDEEEKEMLRALPGLVT